jgi:FAD/FMN-containing dehydrogenase
MNHAVQESLVGLRVSLAGAVLGPSDAEYDAARRCFNALVDRRPAVIARCAGAPDVATAFDFARAHGLEVAVRGGGHNPAGHCVVDEGLVIDLSTMRTVEVDPVQRVASANGGATWLDFDSAAQKHGLVTPGGVVGSTGVCGLTLGGGIGHLTAQHVHGFFGNLRPGRDHHGFDASGDGFQILVGPIALDLVRVRVDREDVVAALS